MPTHDSTRINLRTSPEAKAMIERAAELMGTTVSAFMLQHAYEAARQVVTDNETLVLTELAFQHFVSTAESQPEPNTALKKLMAPR